MERKWYLIIFIILIMVIILLLPKTEKFDVLVIGAGGGGMTAAIEADKNGADVVIMEKLPVIGGNTIKATDGINAWGTSQQKKAGIKDNADRYYEDMLKNSNGNSNNKIMKLFAYQSKTSLEWLEEKGAKFQVVEKMIGSSVPRTHRPLSDTAVGVEIVRTLENEIKKQKIDIRVETEVLEIERDKELFIVKIRDSKGNIKYVKSKKVIIATGGFAGNERRIEKYRPDIKGLKTLSELSNLGDGLELGKSLGAKLVSLGDIRIYPTAIEKNNLPVSELVRLKGGILLNSNGQHFVDELYGPEEIADMILKLEEKRAYLILDESVKEKLEELGEEDIIKNMVKKNTLDELKIDLNLKSIEDARIHFKKPPFYGISVVPVVYQVTGGLLVDERGRVFDYDNQPIEGLYSVGETVGGIYDTMPITGSSLSDIITLGRIAGEEAAKK